MPQEWGGGGWVGMCLGDVDVDYLFTSPVKASENLPDYKFESEIPWTNNNFVGEGGGDKQI